MTNTQWWGRNGGRIYGAASRLKARRAWSCAKQRCSNRNLAEYRSYGARGISVCRRWLNNFEAFVAHVGYPIRGDVSLDRIDNDGCYVPGNVRWATFAEQQSNRQKRVTRRTVRS